MKCVWCWEETDKQYIVYKKPKKKLDGEVLPLCHKHKVIVVGDEVLPFVPAATSGIIK